MHSAKVSANSAGLKTRTSPSSTGESPQRLPELATDLVRLKVNIIIGSTPGVRAAQHATTSIPIVMCIADDAVKQKFVPNLARPGGNITGMASFASELAGKRCNSCGRPHRGSPALPSSGTRPDLVQTT